jgi:hypothetical protein
MTREWKCGTGLAIWVAALVLAFGRGADGQSARSNATPPRISTPGALQPETQMQADVFREIDDPSSGDCWLLMRDPGNLGGPGKLVLETRSTGKLERRRSNPANTISGTGSTAYLGSGVAATRFPVIHAGDRLIVEENTPVVESRLEAVALNPAKVGSVFKVRLAIGGKVVRARALGPGRAAFAEKIGAQP